MLADVNLRIGRGETVGLRGPSGSGKSTLVRVLALLHHPDHGRVSIDGTRSPPFATPYQSPSGPAPPPSFRARATTVGGSGSAAGSRSLGWSPWRRCG
ncbi:ATP-binding cassette domain-containing protein [Micromonospora sp. NPDC049662]|uniref:ATP-binding cassette domain-containing protein n=1 Tax=Micromonospora sp. NPDC049662 TaxID=3155397 RepID=UPI003423213D